MGLATEATSHNKLVTGGAWWAVVVVAGDEAAWRYRTPMVIMGGVADVDVANNGDEGAGQRALGRGRGRRDKIAQCGHYNKCDLL